MKKEPIYIIYWEHEEDRGLDICHTLDGAKNIYGQILETNQEGETDYKNVKLLKVIEVEQVLPKIKNIIKI